MAKPPLSLDVRSTVPMELEPGWEVLVVLREPLYVGGNRCYVGQVRSCSAIGLRITHIDWLVGAFCGADFWFPWVDVRGIEVYTDTHDPSHVDYGLQQLYYNNGSDEQRMEYLRSRQVNR